MPEFEDQNESEGSKLRKQLEDALRENRELKATVKERAVEDILRDKGFDPGAKALVVAQVKDPSEIESWLEANGKFLARRQEAPPEPPAPAAPAVSPEHQAAIQAITHAAPGPGVPTPSSLWEEMGAAKTQEELHAFMRKYSAPVVG